jgi:hypothetical protein
MSAYYYIRELVAFNKITIKYISIKEIIANILIKSLLFIAFKHCI